MDSKIVYSKDYVRERTWEQGAVRESVRVIIYNYINIYVQCLDMHSTTQKIRI